MATDPVCRMDVDPGTARWMSDHRGERYYFCAPGCKAVFDQDPEKYLSGGGHGDMGHGGHGGHGHNCCGH